MAKIYIVEDDSSIRDLVLYALSTTEMSGVGYASGVEFWKAMSMEFPDLILLDIMLPGEDGLSILEQLRKRKDTKDIPVILLTAKTSEYDRIKGLDIGADDYVSKPFSVFELMARIKAVLRRTKREVDVFSNISFKEVTVYPEQYNVQVSGKSIVLTSKEFEILFLLISHPERVFKRDELMNKIWGVDFQGETRTVDMHIKTLRQKLQESGNIIKTIRGVGYKVGQ